MNLDQYQARAAIMKALASPVRLRILDELAGGERCLCELQPLFRMNKSTLSRHLAALKQVGIVRDRRDGARVYVYLATPCILDIFECVMNVLRSEAQHQVECAGGTEAAFRRQGPDENEGR